jgi:hypothetical protein
VIGGGTPVLLLIDKLLQRGLLFSTALKHQDHATKRCGISKLALVELGARQRMRVAGEDRKMGVIHGLQNSRPGSGQRRLRRSRGEGSKE